MKCSHCGANSEDNAKFCANCGAPLEPGVQPTQAMPTQPAAAVPPVENASAGSAQPQPGVSVMQAPESNGKAVGSLVCGILAILLSETIVLGIILGIVAIALGASAAKQTGDGKAKAGKVCGIVGTVLSVLTLVMCLVAGVAIFKFIENNPDEVKLINIEVGSSSSSTHSSSSAASKGSDSSKSSSSSASASSSSGASADEDVYKNARFGYSLELPDGFTKLFESANGDGANFESKALNMKVLVSGKNNANGLTPEQLMETWFQGSPETTKEIGDNYALFTQVEDGMMHIYFAYVGAGSIDQMDIVYSMSGDYSKQIDAAEELVDGFKAGNIAAAC